jgi:hypothetical protein
MKSPYGRGWNATNVPRPGRKCPAFGTGFSREAAKNRGISPAGAIVDRRPPADGPRELAPGSPRMEEYDGHAPLWFSVSTRPRRLTRPGGRSCVQGSGDTSDIVPRYQRPHDRGRISVAGWGTPLKSFAGTSCLRRVLRRRPPCRRCGQSHWPQPAPHVAQCVVLQYSVGESNESSLL